MTQAREREAGVPCLFGPGKFCLVHWRFCAVRHSPHARGVSAAEAHIEATFWACRRIRRTWLDKDRSP